MAKLMLYLVVQEPYQDYVYGILIKEKITTNASVVKEMQRMGQNCFLPVDVLFLEKPSVFSSGIVECSLHSEARQRCIGNSKIS